MQIRKPIIGALTTAIILIALNASAQFRFTPPPGSAPPLTRNVPAEVAQMTQRYGLSEDQARKVTTILQDEASKSEQVFSDSTLNMRQQMSQLQSLKQEEISRVSQVLTPEQKQKYEADLRPTPPGPSSAAGVPPALPNLPPNQ